VSTSAKAAFPRTEVAVISKALDLIECLAEEPLTAAEISARILVSKPTVYRLLRTLQSRDFVAKELEGTRYTLGKACRALGYTGRSSSGLIALAHPLMTRLNNSYGEGVNLAIPSNGGMLYIDTIESKNQLRTQITVGTRDSIHSTALGKAVLAALPEDEAKVVLSNIDRVPHTPNTVVTISALLRQRAAVRERGFAIDDQEHELGSVCVASAFRDQDGRPLGAMSVSGPAARISDELVQVIGKELVDACSVLTEILGSIEISSVPENFIAQ
jgi:DNA-binding IclR family transcriptional regulator